MEFTLLNNTDRRVIDDLRKQLRPHARLQIAAASFSIYAFEALRDELQQTDIDSLFSAGETTALVGDIRGLDDFELICFLVIR